MKQKLACGCTHDGHRWLMLCPPHRAEADEVHARWQAEHEAEKFREAQAQANNNDWLEGT